jgi:hypothetical protein
MDNPVPSWQRKAIEDELETKEILRKQGEQESQRMFDNRMLDDDYLGLDDGRPGIGFGTSGMTYGFGGHVAMYLLWVGGLVLLAAIGYVLKSCAN